MIPLEPEEGAADEKGPHFVSAMVKNIALPFRMISSFGVGMFIEISAIEIDEAILIIRKVRRHPIEDHADPILMQLIDEDHEILRGAIP